ncbi:MAG: phosphatidylserine decarboxylase [Treponema sp.]|nr:phosphatidylserine decarboxylase [Treponema sp.]
MNMAKIDEKANHNDASVEFLYGTRLGKILLEFILALKIPKLLGAFLRSPCSHFYIKKFIRKNGIDMSDFQDYVEANPAGTKKFRSFNDFFTRKKPDSALKVDAEKTHLISPCDSLLSVYKISEDSKFHIKGFDYSLSDFFCGEGADLDSSVLAEQIKRFDGGDCLVFRLCATDYHRFCYFDDGKHPDSIGENHFLEGKLYSVQPKAYENFRIYTKNRRSWTILETANFGNVAQVEVGAFSVGGIVNHLPSESKKNFRRGDEKGYFDLHGSTIVLLFEKGKIRLRDEILESWKNGEVRVKYGEWIGNSN